MSFEVHQMLATALARHGLTEASGVPCSYMQPLLEALAQHGIRYLATGIEGEAVAVMCGSWVAGRPGVVVLQSSGLGHAVNPLMTLARPYGIPLVVVVSWRGEPGTGDASHQESMGEATPKLLNAMGVPHLTIREDTRISEIDALIDGALRQQRQVAVVVPRNMSCKGRISLPAPPVTAGDRPQTTAVAVPRFVGDTLPSRTDALRALVNAFPSSVRVSSTGYISRDLAVHFDAPNNFYMQGSMGFASGIGLGIARVRTGNSVLVIDGDGALLMRLGGLALVAALQPQRLVHVVLDDRVYSSTGGQPRPAPHLEFAHVAGACGYPYVAVCEGTDVVADAMEWLQARLGNGPLFLHLRINPAPASTLSRPSNSPDVVASRVREWIERENGSKQ